MKKILINEKTYSVICVVILGLQIAIDSMNTLNLNQDALLWVGFASLLVSLVASAAKQYLDPRLSNNGLLIQLAMFIAFIAGGVLDYNGMLPFDEGTAAVVRTLLTFISTFIPLLITKI